MKGQRLLNRSASGKVLTALVPRLGGRVSVAKALGVAPSTVKAWTTPSRGCGPSWEMIHRLVEAFGDRISDDELEVLVVEVMEKHGPYYHLVDGTDLREVEVRHQVMSVDIAEMFGMTRTNVYMTVARIMDQLRPLTADF